MLEKDNNYPDPLRNTGSSWKPLGNSKNLLETSWEFKKSIADFLGKKCIRILLGIQNPLGKLSDKKFIIKFIRKLTIFMIFKK